jgi:hypothetical protein
MDITCVKNNKLHIFDHSQCEEASEKRDIEFILQIKEKATIPCIKISDFVKTIIPCPKRFDNYGNNKFDIVVAEKIIPIQSICFFGLLYKKEI